MKILVADDVLANRHLLKKLLTRDQHQVLLAENGQEAVDCFLKEQPDVVLMDIMMPVLDGLEAIRQIRRLMEQRWTPIIVLSALNDDSDIIKGLETGADDYLTKPINHTVLRAKLATISRFIDMQTHSIQTTNSLKVYQQQNEVEQKFAKAVFERMLQQKDLQDPQLQYWLLPAQHFSGDLIAFMRISDNRIYFLLADAIGHGLSAALPTLIVYQIFRGASFKQVLLSNLAATINSRLQTDLPTGHFVALAIGMIDNSNRSIEIWNGGMPDLLVLDGHGSVLHSFKSRHLSAGILNAQSFDDQTELWQWQEPCELFAHSDGISEARNADDDMFGIDRVGECLQAPPGQRIARLQQALNEFVGSQPAPDDISCLCIRCPAQDPLSD